MLARMAGWDGTPASVANLDKISNGFIIYPILVDDVVNIEMTMQNAKGKIEITDLEGRILIELPVNNRFMQIPIHTLAKGLYLVKIKNENQVENKKIIKKGVTDKINGFFVMVSSNGHF